MDVSGYCKDCSGYGYCDCEEIKKDKELQKLKVENEKLRKCVELCGEDTKIEQLIKLYSELLEANAYEINTPQGHMTKEMIKYFIQDLNIISKEVTLKEIEEIK